MNEILFKTIEKVTDSEIKQRMDFSLLLQENEKSKSEECAMFSSIPTENYEQIQVDMINITHDLLIKTEYKFLSSSIN